MGSGARLCRFACRRTMCLHMITGTVPLILIEGKAKAKTIQIVSQFIDEHESEIMEIWGKAQRGEKIEKIRR